MLSIEATAELEFKRDELYTEVWQSPLTQLGKKYGLSDNGLRKVCKEISRFRSQHPQLVAREATLPTKLNRRHLSAKPVFRPSG